MSRVRHAVVACAALATAGAAFAANPPAKNSALSAARDMHVVVLPSAFRVHGVYMSNIDDVLNVIRQAQPSAVVINVCVLTPEKVVAGFQSRLYGVHAGGQAVVRLGRRALECAFPTEAELAAARRL